jgi:hypothetical protein
MLLVFIILIFTSKWALRPYQQVTEAIVRAQMVASKRSSFSFSS